MTSEPAAAPGTHTSVDAPADALGDVSDGMPTEGGGLRRWIRSRATALSVALLAVLAYLPSLGSSPGRMPADTKLYLYLEPAELLGRASSTLEREQFGGWVPHQQITYLWPSACRACSKAK